MSTIVKTEAVVLRSIDFKETSKIVTFYTRQFGKIAGMIKGARRPKSKFGTSLNPMSYVSLIIYKKEGREIQIVSQCDLIKPFRHLSEDIEKMAVGMAMIELVNIVTPEHAENAQLFLLLVNSLSSLNHAVKNPSSLLFYFEIHLARVLGFQPVLGHCVTCKKELKKINDDATYRFDIGKGGVVCKKCSAAPGQRSLLPANVLKILQQINSSNQIDSIFDLNLSDESKRILGSFIWTFLQYHVHGLRALKTHSVFSKIFNMI